MQLFGEVEIAAIEMQGFQMKASSVLNHTVQNICLKRILHNECMFLAFVLWIY